MPNGTHSLVFTATGTDATTSPKDVVVTNNTFTLSDLKAGTYSAFSITYNNCTGSDATSKMLSQPATPTITAGLPSSPSSCSTADGSIAFTSTNLPNGNYNLTYTGAGSPKTVTVTSNAFSLTGLDNGIYSNFSLSSNGCTASDATSKTVNNPSAPTLTAGNVTNTTTCASTDGKIAFTTNLPTGTYTLNYTGSGSPKMITVANGAFNLTDLPDGTFSGFSITHAGCTSTNNVTKTVSDPAAPILTAGLGTNPTTCVSFDGKIAFTTSLPNGPYSLSYTGVGSPKTINVAGGAFELTGLPDGTFSGFSVTVGGCTGIANTTKTLTDPTAPTLTAGLATNATACNGTNGKIAFTTNLPNGPYQLTYTGAGSPKSITVAAGAFELTNLPDGTYSGFSITTGGCTGIDNTSKTLMNPPPSTITAGLGTNPTTCLSVDGKIAFTTSLPNGTYSLRFTGVGSPKNVVVSSGAFDLTGLPDGMFSAFSLTTGGCTGIDNTSKTLTDPVPPTITAGLGTNPTTCLSIDGKIAFTTSLPNGTYSMNYTGFGTPKTVTVSAGKFDLTGLPDGEFSGFSITTGGCTGIANVSKTLSDPANPTITAGIPTNPTTCSGTNGSIPFTTSLPDGPYSLSYTGAGSPQNITVASGRFTLGSLRQGTYSGFSVTIGGCTGIDNTSKSLNDPTPPTLTVGTVNNPMTCGGANGSIPFTTTNLPDGTYSLRFSRSGTGATTSPQNVTISGNAFTLQNLKGGTYSNFLITNATTNCIGTAEAVITLSNPTNPTLTKAASPTICAGATSFTIPYTATTGTPTKYSISGVGITTVTSGNLPANAITVQLSGGATGSSISYSLTVNNAISCTSANIAGSVAVNAPLSISTPTVGFMLCQGSETTIRALANGGNGVYQYSLNGGVFQTNPVFTVRAGNYTITAKDGLGCIVSTASTTVQDGFPALQCPQPMTVDASQMGANGSVPTSVSGDMRIISQCLTPSSTAVTDQVFDVTCGVVSPQNNSFSPNSLIDVQKAIVRTFSAGSGIITYSCAQVIFVRQPRLEDVVFPANRTLTCTNLRTEPTDAVVNNAVVTGTGAPNSAGTTLNETAQKGLSATYTDVRTTTATGFTIQRSWTVSKCGTTRTVVQTITVPTCGTAPSIAGSIGRENGTAVPATTLLFNSLTGRTDSTTGTTYSFANILTNSNIRVKPTRPNTDWTSGVTMLDVSLLSRHVLDVNLLTSPYSIISADVNSDGEVDATDMLLMQRLILRLIPALPNTNSWRFVVKNHVFRNPSNPLASDFPEILVVPNLTSALANGDFVAIKVGDLNQSAGTVTIRGGAKAFMLNTEDRVLEQGKTYQIPIQMTPSVSSLQFTLNVDKNAAKINSIESGNLPNFTDNNTGLFQKEGMITAAWYRKNDQSLNETNNFTMMTVTLTPTKNARLSEIMTLNSAYTEGVAYDAKGTGLPVQLAFDNKMASNEKAVLLPNRPNPFSNETTLSFTLPEAGKAKLTVCDLLGKVLMSSEQAFAKGLNEVVFDATHTPSVSGGVFVVRLQTAMGVAEQKIVLQR